MRFQTRDSDVVWEMVEGEMLLIDLLKGVYYSLRGGTSQLASDLLHGMTAEETVQRWQARFPDSDLARAAESASGLVSYLGEHALIVPRQGDPESAPDHELTRHDFPEIEQYEDMKEIFEMDPIHDGDLERGWPVHN